MEQDGRLKQNDADYNIKNIIDEISLKHNGDHWGTQWGENALK